VGGGEFLRGLPGPIDERVEFEKAALVIDGDEPCRGS